MTLYWYYAIIWSQLAKDSKEEKKCVWKSEDFVALDSLLVFF